MGAAPVRGVTCRHLNRRDSVTKTLFLPGASGSAAFWKPVADRLACNVRLFAWPGLGREPAQQGIESFDDLITMVKAEIDAPVTIVAQSMGGYIALQGDERQPTWPAPSAKLAGGPNRREGVARL